MIDTIVNVMAYIGFIFILAVLGISFSIWNVERKMKKSDKKQSIKALSDDLDLLREKVTKLENWNKAEKTLEIANEDLNGRINVITARLEAKIEKLETSRRVGDILTLDGKQIVITSNDHKGNIKATTVKTKKVGKK